MQEQTAILAALERAVVDGDDGAARRLVEEALAAGVAPLVAVDQACVPGIREAGRLWEEGEYFLPELVMSAQAMKAAMALLQPRLEQAAAAHVLGCAVIGTMQGDIHDIGKTLVATLLAANGFGVSDEGVDVPIERFVRRARELDADLVCASALLTTTMEGQRGLVEAVRGAGLRAKVLVGGAPVSRAWADAIGADGFADSAVGAVEVARALVSRP